jgi:sugar-specific transcriptional regulator TrmB
MNSDARTLQALMNLGLTALEAEIYTLLLQQSPATGYAVAKELGKPAPNVYKALETLEAKGAIEVDRGETRVCRPVPAGEMLSLLERRFREQRDLAADGLRRLPGPEDDARIYHLRNRDQIVEKVGQLLAGTKTIALIDAHWNTLDELKPDLEQAVARGVIVAFKAYSEVEVDGVEVTVDPKHEEMRTRWPAQWFVMAVDGSQILQSLVTADGSRVVQAVWSSSPFLSWMLHSSLHHEIAWTAASRMLVDGESIDPVEKMEELNERYRAPDAQGYHRLRHLLDLVEDDESR